MGPILFKTKIAKRDGKWSGGRLKDKTHEGYICHTELGGQLLKDFVGKEVVVSVVEIIPPKELK